MLSAASEQCGVLSDTRAMEVRERLLSIKQGAVQQFLEMAALLLEARDNEYHKVYGFGEFGDWTEKELELSGRNAYYALSVITGADKLGIPRDELMKMKVSQLKEIFSLDADEYEGDMRKLLAEAPNATAGDIRDAVATLKQEREGIEPQLLYTIKIPRSAKPIIRRAIDKVKADDGGREITDGYALEMICSDFLGGE